MTSLAAAPRVRIVSGAALWAVSGIFIQLAGANSATTMIFRTAIALPLLAPWALVELRRLGGVTRPVTIRLLVGGVLLGLDFALWTHAVSLIGAGTAMVVGGVYVVVAPVLDRVLRGQRMSRTFVLTAPVLLIGVALAGDAQLGAAQGSAAAGTMLAALAGITYGLFIFTVRAIPQSGHLAVPSFVTCLSCGVVGTLFGLVFGAPDLTPSAESLLWIALMAVFSQVFALALVTPSLGHVSAATGATLLLLTPVIAWTLGVALLGDRPSATQIVGAVVAILCIGVVSLQRDLPQAPSQMRAEAGDPELDLRAVRKT